MSLLNQIKLPGFSGMLEILVLAFVIYYVMLFLHGTRGAHVLYGFVFLLMALMILTRVFSLHALNWILQGFSVYLALAFLIIFQPEIRRALAELGKQPVFMNQAAKKTIVDHIIAAVQQLADRKIGALVAIERDIGTRAIQETGTRMDCLVTSEILASIFYPQTPLHDGGVIVHHDRILAAGCVFPLSQRAELSRSLGTRHRAAIGLTEETDAIVVVVSEETGSVSVAYKGRLSRGLDEARLRRVLSSALVKGGGPGQRISRVKKQLDLTPEGVAKTDGLKVEERDKHES